MAALALFASSAHASFINYALKEINCKIVYYGPATAGLHENLAYIYARTNPDAKGKTIALRTAIEKTESFEFLPLSLGEIRGFKVRLQLYTTPGKAGYNASRVLLLKGVDGVIFVADSDPKQLAATLASWAELKTNLATLGYDWQQMPIVIQLDHRDLKNAMSVAELEKALGVTNEPIYEAVARTGVGVFDTLKALAKKVLTALKKGE
jgi:signal recognition particle receptor subunit beta